MGVYPDENHERRRVSSARNRKGRRALHQGHRDTRYEDRFVAWSFSTDTERNVIGKHIAGVIGAINDAILHAIPPVGLGDHNAVWIS
jgi:hypothetical protein